MRRLFSAVLVLILVLVLSPGLSGAESGDVFVTIGLLPKVTRAESVIIRGSAPRGAIVVVSVNGKEAGRTLSGPGMDRYAGAVAPLTVGENRIVSSVTVGGQTATAESVVFRSTVSFTDMEIHWAHDDVEVLATHGVVNGVGGGDFAPNVQINRAQFAKAVVLGLGLTPELGTDLSFRDGASLPGWARGHVAAAVKAGLIKGYEDGDFRPDSPVTRLEMAVIISRGLRLKGAGEGQETAFADGDQIPAWARVDVALATSAKVISGYEDKTFRPGRVATRAEAAVMVRRLMKAVAPR